MTRLLFVPPLPTRAFLALLTGTALFGAPSPRDHAPVFPVEFELVGSKWVAQGPDYRLVLGWGGAVLTLVGGRNQTTSIGVRLEGARRGSPGVPETEAAGRRNYLIGPDSSRWRTNVRLWKAVRFPGALKGVDIVFHGGERRFEYDLVVAPGADPGAIRLVCSGASKVEPDPSGDLVLHTAAGDIIQHKPVAYQMHGSVRREVSASFRLHRNRIAFEVGPYDHSRPLIIDPVIDYAAKWPARIYAMAADSSGAAYITGYTSLPSLPITGGAYQAKCGTDGACNGILFHYDAYVAKFSPDGSTLIYCTYLGGSDNDRGLALAVDGAGHAVVGGSTVSSDFPITSTIANVGSAGTDSFVAKLNADGSGLQWSVLSPARGLSDIGIDGQGNVFFLCSPYPQFGVFTTPGAISTGGAERWLGELDASGSHVLYATYVPGLRAESAGSGSMVVKGDGTVWIAGTSQGGINLLDEGARGGICSSRFPPTPAVVVGIDPRSSTLLWRSSVGGSHGEFGTSVGADAAGNIYLAGVTCSSDFPGIDQSIVNFTLGDFASFVVKLDAGTGARLWTRTSTDWAWRLATDAAGNTAVLRGPGNSSGGYLDYVDTFGNLVWTAVFYPLVTLNAGYPPPIGLAMDPGARIYVSPSLGGATNGWVADPRDWSTNVSRIEPRGGTLVVLPERIDLTWSDGWSQVVVGAVGGAFSLPYTATTSTPWLEVRYSPPYASQGAVVPLPNVIGWPTAEISFIRVGVRPDAGLQPGSYDGSLTVAAPGFANSPLTVPVHYVVSGTASPPSPGFPLEILVTTSSQYAGVPAVFPPNARVTSQTPWIEVSATGRVTINEYTRPYGLNRGQLTVEIPGDPHSPYQVTIVVCDLAPQGGGGPVTLNASPGFLSFLAQTGDSPKHGDVALQAPHRAVRTSFGASSQAPWLSVSPATGTAPGILSITADPTELQPGNYYSHIEVRTDQAANSLIRIPVSLTIQQSVPVNVAPVSVAVRHPPGANPQQVTVSITSAQPLPFTVSGLPVQPMTGTTPAQLTINIPPTADSAGGALRVAAGSSMFVVPVVVLDDFVFPVIFPGGVVNAATFQRSPVAPGSIVSIFGTELAPATFAASAFPLPRDAPFQMRLLQIPDPVDYAKPAYFYLSPEQWNLQLPWSTQPGTNSFAVADDHGSLPHFSPYRTFEVAPIAPYIFVLANNRGVIQNADYSLNTPSNPVAAGSALVVYLTGQGAVDPPVGTGQAASVEPLSRVKATTTATLDDRPVEVLFAGLTPGLVGVGQVNVRVPNGFPSGDHKLVINIGGINTNEVVVSTK